MESQEQQPTEEQAPPPPPPLRSKPPIRLLVSRGYTIIFLLITLILLSINLSKNNNGITVEAPPKPPAQSKIGNIGSCPPAPAPQPTYTPAPAPQPTSTPAPTPQPTSTPAPAPQTTYQISPKGSQGSSLTASALGAGCNLFQFGLLVYCMVTGKDLTRNKYNILFNYYIDKAVALVLATGAGAGLGPLLDMVKVTGSGSFTFLRWEKISTPLLASAIISTSISSSCSAAAMRDYKRTVENADKGVGKLGHWATKACNCCFEP